ncbi:MAG: head GIN domain-containing protein [Anaerolineae bacterium]
MFKKLITIFVLITVIASFGLVGCAVAVRGSGDVIEETREISNFDRVALDGMGEIILTQGETTSLIVEAEDNLMQYIKTTVRGDELTINIQSRRPIIPSRSIKFYITTPNLEAVSVDGAGVVSIDELDTDSLKLSMDGSGYMNIDELDASELLIDINGLGDLDVAGSTNSLEIDIDGSGNFNGRNLESQTASIDIDGLGNATINVENSLDVNVDGSGQVTYYGDPVVSQDINGLGRVVRK